MAVILFRESLVEPSELEAASKYFDVYFYADFGAESPRL